MCVCVCTVTRPVSSCLHPNDSTDFRLQMYTDERLINRIHARTHIQYERFAFDRKIFVSILLYRVERERMFDKTIDVYEKRIYAYVYIFFFFSENDNSHAAYRSTRVRFRDQFNARAINRSRRRIFDSSFVKHYASGVVIEKPTGLYCAATRTHDIVVGRYIDQRHTHDTHTRSSAAEPSRFFFTFPK